MSPGLFASRPRFSVPLPSGRALDLGARTLVMGIVNVTPDSFADGGERFDPDRAIADAAQMVADGAEIIDVGGESTRPGADPLPADEEWRRVAPVIEGIRARVDVPISIDTYKAVVADRALDLGAAIVNDISALLYDPPLAGVVARRGAAVVLMHNRGRSRDMYAEAVYSDVALEVARELADRARAAEAAGVSRDRIVLDPGLGFAKRAEHSLDALARLDVIGALGYPILSGPSRKSFLKTGLGDVPPRERVWGTAAAVTASVLLGAHIVRVHDVKEMVQVVRVADRIAARSVAPTSPARAAD
ncbi:MAG TPA: dihydropteroate synthase [Vicinamibacterales bacterium]|nr:dihydropteroate synthase [Vicinamibacterales bacterium]